MSVWRVRRAGIEDRHAPVVLIGSTVSRKFAQRRRTARRSTAVSGGRLASVFKHPHLVTCSWTAMTGFLDMTKRSPKCLTQQP